MAGAQRSETFIRFSKLKTVANHNKVPAWIPLIVAAVRTASFKEAPFHLGRD